MGGVGSEVGVDVGRMVMVLVRELVELVAVVVRSGAGVAVLECLDSLVTASVPELDAGTGIE